MSMTREEAIRLLKQYQGYEPLFPDGEKLRHAFDLTDETVDTLLSALRPVSREQMEKVWKGEWVEDDCDERTYICTKCEGLWATFEGSPADNCMRFCPGCGAPMTGEAVQMLLERLEALNDEKQ